MATTLADEWKRLEGIVMAKDEPGPVTDALKLEMQRSFYSGAFVVLLQMREIGDEKVSEDEGVKRIEAMYSEAMAYMLALLATDKPLA